MWLHRWSRLAWPLLCHQLFVSVRFHIIDRGGLPGSVLAFLACFSAETEV